MTKITVKFLIVFLLTTAFSCQEKKALVFSIILNKCPSSRALSFPENTEIDGWSFKYFENLSNCGQGLIASTNAPLKASEGFDVSIKLSRNDLDCTFNMATTYDQRLEEKEIVRIKDNLNFLLPKFLDSIGFKNGGHVVFSRKLESV